MFEQRKQCGACGASFECGGLWACWCGRVRLDDAARRELRERYDDCLCPKCLEQYSVDTRASAASRAAASTDDPRDDGS